jgi:hypothetical protein
MECYHCRNHRPRADRGAAGNQEPVTARWSLRPGVHRCAPRWGAARSDLRPAVLTPQPRRSANLDCTPTSCAAPPPRWRSRPERRSRSSSRCSATMTMDTDGHLSEKRPDEVAESHGRGPRGSPRGSGVGASAGRCRCRRRFWCCPVVPRLIWSTWPRVEPQVSGLPRGAPPVGFEPTPPPPEGGALSPELRGLTVRNERT